LFIAKFIGLPPSNLFNVVLKEKNNKLYFVHKEFSIEYKSKNPSKLKKGYFFNKINFSNHEKIILFTENIRISKLSKLKTNMTSNYIKYPKKNLDNFMYTNIKKNMRDILSEIFKNQNII
jgi:ABC-type sugar transport system ATPase subunit